ncbi:CD209 antigen-like isoform X2 [Silurus meridionalis]|uniref:CD209 antigen-like isoform X2 n=1 Tax=Silurus meridionalis TaxID=175797 RepID=UPI001EEB0D46|nr:CD209 antigen-like isoform X2 [Silurus meridionalis]
MNEEVYENYSGASADSRADDPKDIENSYEDIYANKVPETQVTRSNDGTILRSNNGIISERGQLETSFNNLTIERDQLQSSYNNLNMEKSQLQTSYNNLNMEKSQLQTSYNNLNMEKSQLQTSFNNLNMEKSQLQTSFNNLNMEKSQLQTRYNNIAAEKEHLSQLKKDITTPGWRYFSSSIYYISTEKKSWSESRKDCQGRGADLVIINSSEEQDFVEVWRRNQGVWIGANDKDSEGTWKWVDGTTVINGFWNPGEPNSNWDEDCAVSGFHPGNGKWDDVSCNNNYIWICEKRLNM